MIAYRLPEKPLIAQLLARGRDALEPRPPVLGNRGENAPLQIQRLHDDRPDPQRRAHDRARLCQTLLQAGAAKKQMPEVRRQHCRSISRI